MNFKKTSHLIVVLLLALLLLVSCSSGPRSGVVRGTLVTASGEPPTDKYSIVMCKVETDAENCTLATDYQTTAINGKFSIRSVPVGKYAILISSPATGQGVLLQREDGKTLVIILEEGKDFDLGTIPLK